MKRILIVTALVTITTPAFALCSYIGGTTICQDSGIYTETPNERAYRPPQPQYVQPYSGQIDPRLPYGSRLHSCHYGVCE